MERPPRKKLAPRSPRCVPGQVIEDRQLEYSWEVRGVSSNPFRFLASCLKVDTENNCRVGPYIAPNLEPAILPHVIGQREAGGKSGVPHRIFAIGRVPGRGSGPKFHGLGFRSSARR